MKSQVNYEGKSSRDLIDECLKGNQIEAWKEFVRRFQPLISGIIARIAREYQDHTTGLVDELTQDVFLKLCDKDSARLRRVKVSGDESLYAYLKVVAVNLARDYFRADRAKKRGPNSYGGGLEVADRQQGPPSLARMLSSEQGVLLKEVNECLDIVTGGDMAKRDRLIFRMHHYQGFTAAEIALIPSIGLGPKGVESLLRRILASLRDELMARAPIKASAKA